jgi:hypothetical protein
MKHPIGAHEGNYFWSLDLRGVSKKVPCVEPAEGFMPA